MQTDMLMSDINFFFLNFTEIEMSLPFPVFRDENCYPAKIFANNHEWSQVDLKDDTIFNKMWLTLLVKQGEND